MLIDHQTSGYFNLIQVYGLQILAILSSPATYMMHGILLKELPKVEINWFPVLLAYSFIKTFIIPKY